MHNVNLSILCAILVTASIRVLPILFFANRRFPFLLKTWLTFVPTAIFTAIIVTGILDSKGVSMFGLSVGLLAASSALIVSLIFRNLFSAVIASIVFYLFFEYYEVIANYFHINL